MIAEKQNVSGDNHKQRMKGEKKRVKIKKKRQNLMIVSHWCSMDGVYM